MRIQAVCVSLPLGSVLNTADYAVNKTEYLQLKSVGIEVEAGATKKTLELEINTKKYLITHNAPPH